MHLAVYIGLNCLYFIFGVLLVNTIRKEFFSQAKKKIFKVGTHNDIFIPEQRDKSNYYLNQLLKQPHLPNFIFILPRADLLLQPENFWNVLNMKYIHNLDYVFNYLTPCYDPDSYQDRRRLELDIHTSKTFPMFFILRGRKNDNSIFKVEDKKDYFDLESKYRENNFQLIQRIESNIFSFQNKIFVLETYLLCVRRPLEEGNKKQKHKVEMYRSKNIRYMLLDMISGKLVGCQKMEALLQTNFFSTPYEVILKDIQKKYDFLAQNFCPVLGDKIEGLDSTCFEILSVKFILNSRFETYIYRIDRDIEIFDNNDSIIFTALVNEVYTFLKKKKKLNTEILIPIC